MASTKARFTQADVKRALKAANDAGVNVRVEIEPTGKIILMPVRPVRVAERNEWDEPDK